MIPKGNALISFLIAHWFIIADSELITNELEAHPTLSFYVCTFGAGACEV